MPDATSAKVIAAAASLNLDPVILLIVSTGCLLFVGLSNRFVNRPNASSFLRSLVGISLKGIPNHRGCYYLDFGRELPPEAGFEAL